MAHDYRDVANEIDRLIRVGYGGQDLLTRLATKYPHLTQVEFNKTYVASFRPAIARFFITAR